MMMRSLLILFYLFICSTGIAQVSTFIKTYTGAKAEVAFSVKQTKDGGYILAGITNSLGNGMDDVYLIKTDVDGIKLWEKTYGGSNDEWAGQVNETADGGFVIMGLTESYGPGINAVYLIKTDQNGDTLWTRTYGGGGLNYGLSGHQTLDSGFIIAGSTTSFNGDFDIYLIKTDANGDTLWTKTYGGVYDDWGEWVEQTSDGGYIITGYTYSFGLGQRDVYVVKTDANGNLQWSKTYGTNEDDTGNSVHQTMDGGYIIGGYTYFYAFANGFDSYLIKVDSNGNEEWSRVFISTGSSITFSVKQISDGGYILGGFANEWLDGNLTDNFSLIRTNSMGDTLWTKFFGTSIVETCYSVELTSDGGYALAGETSTMGKGDHDIYFVKCDSLGTVTGIRSIQTQPVKGLQIIPNPFSSSTIIQIPEPFTSESVSLSIYDLFGREVNRIDNIVSATLTLYKGDLKSGLYIYKLIGDEGILATGKLIVQ